MRIKAILLFWFAGVLAAPGQLVNVVVPNNLANTEGNTSANDVLTSFSFRLQMVFDASQFPLSSGPNVTNAISSISFRLDGMSTGDAVTLFSGASVSLSVTPRGPDSLSPVFAENIGVNRVTVFNGALTLGSSFSPGENPQPFGTVVIATAPFYYSPNTRASDRAFAPRWIGSAIIVYRGPTKTQKRTMFTDGHKFFVRVASS